MAFNFAKLGSLSEALRAAGGAAFSREALLEENLPYIAVINDNVIVQREGDLMATLRLEGVNPTTTEDQDLDALRGAVAAIVAQCGASFGFYVHRVQRPQDVVLKPIEGDGFAAQIDARWRHHIAQLAPKKRQLYISVLRRPELAARMPFMRKLANTGWVKDRDARARELNEVMGFLETALARAVPERLTAGSGEWFGFLNSLNSGRLSALQTSATFGPIRSQLANADVTFAGDVILQRDPVTGEARWGAIFAVKSYPSLTSVCLLDEMDLSCDMVVTNSFAPIPNNVMGERIGRIIRQMDASEDAAFSLRDQLIQAADDQESGRIAFGSHHLSVAIYDVTSEALEAAAAEVKRAAQEMGAVMVRENFAAKATFFAQHPGNFKYRPRATAISSVNFADFAALHANAGGRAKDLAPWGENITVLPAKMDSAYRFNFHEAGSPDKEPTLGHTLVVGRTGSGKTVTTAFLAAQARRAGARLIFFDKDRGLEMAVRALGGTYRAINAGTPTGLNPFRSETDAKGKAWLTDWIGTLIGNGTALSGSQARHLQRAVNQNATAAESLQSFVGFEELFGSLDDAGALQSQIGQWSTAGRYGWVFRAREDGAALALDGNIIGFDMTEILDMQTERMAVLSYVFRLIERLMTDRKPTILVLDEAWKLLDDPYFETRLENWLVTLRKMNGVVVMMTQYPSQLHKSRVGKVIVETVPTQILFPNDRARPGEFLYLGVNEKEAEMLTSPTLGRRLALVRSAGDSLLVNVDLSPLGPLLKVLGGGVSGEAAAGEGWRDRNDFWRDVK